MKYKHLPIMRLFIICLLLVSFSVDGQQYNIDTEPAAYYIDLNSAHNTKVYDLQEGMLSLEYRDLYGRNPEMPFRIYDHKRMLITELILDKSFGLNHYNINLNEAYGHWIMEQTYTGEAVDDLGKGHKLLFRFIPPPETEKPDIDILVNPLNADCDNIADNVIEYYGQIEGGNAPYTVTWYVLNDARSSFLYQPREETIKAPGNTMLISVDKAPGYHVLLHVVDACGMEQQQMVQVMCEEDRKNIHTLFFEKLEPPVKKPQGGL